VTRFLTCLAAMLSASIASAEIPNDKGTHKIGVRLGSFVRHIVIDLDGGECKVKALPSKQDFGLLVSVSHRGKLYKLGSFFLHNRKGEADSLVK